MDNKWDSRFIGLAQFVSTWSKDPSTQVGAVIVDYDNRVVSLGYNGFPKHVLDSKERLNNREEKYRFVVHAEENAILNSSDDVFGCSIYVTHFPCSHCMAVLAQAGIKRVVSKLVSVGWEERFPESYRVSKEIANECDIILEFI